MRRALDLGADSIGFTEAYRLIPFMRRRPAWRIAVGQSPDSLRGPGDVPVLVRRRNKAVERYAFQACNRAAPLELAPERWITGHAYRHPLGVIEHVNHHPNPYRAPRATLSLRREYRVSMERLEATLELTLKRGRLPVVTGDFNLPSAAPFEYAPRALFDHFNLNWLSVGVDWIAWHRSLIEIGRRVIHSNGQDHPWIVLDLEGFRGQP